jgi:hypothetical protein
VRKISTTESDEIGVDQKNLASTLTRHERRAMVEPAHPAVPLVAQADILSLSRSSL